MSCEISNYNVQTVRSEIQRLQEPDPVMFTVKNAKSVLTDYDTFPYHRYWRGDYKSSAPIIAEREAGWRPRKDSCFKVENPPKAFNQPFSYPNHCFQTASNVAYPCHPSYLAKYAEKETLDTILNRGCIIQYR